MKEKITTCQICERPIKSKSGILAHHGYKRPWKQGWQTGSCAGARNLPYEVSRDLIPPVIERIEKFSEGLESAIREWNENPPEKISKVDPYRPPKVFARPEGFDPKENAKKPYFSHDEEYEHEFFKVQRERSREKGYAERDAARLRKRYDDWKPKA